MREKPILFSGAMIRAILAGTKSQTRRVVKPQPDLTLLGPTVGPQGRYHYGKDAQPIESGGKWQFAIPGAALYPWLCPYGQPGDRLWVRETFLLLNAGAHCVYREDAVDALGCAESAGFASMYGGWKPSIFMSRKWSRITLEVTGVRVERLQEISEEDAIAEGVDSHNHAQKWPDGDPGYMHDTARRNYCAVWNEINDADGKRWCDNPFVWVATFQRVMPGAV